MSATEQSLDTVVVENDRLYDVRTARSANRFRVTIPAGMVQEADIEHGDRLAFTPDIDSDGNLTLIYTAEEHVDNPQMTVSVSRSSSGVVSIPSASGLALGIGSGAVKWNLVEKTESPLDADGDTPDSYNVLHGDVWDTSGDEETRFTLPEVAPSAGRPMAMEPIDHKVQSNVEHEGQSWSQEQFRRYVAVDEMDQLGWAEGSRTVGVRLMRRGSRPAIVFDPNEDSELLKTVNPPSADVRPDGMLYVPADIVRSFGLMDVPLMWVEDEGRLIATPTGRSPTTERNT